MEVRGAKPGAGLWVWGAQGVRAVCAGACVALWGTHRVGWL